MSPIIRPFPKCSGLEACPFTVTPFCFPGTVGNYKSVGIASIDVGKDGPDLLTQILEELIIPIQSLPMMYC